MSAIQTTKLIRTIKTLNENELKIFDKWLHSPWCNTNKNLITLLEKVKKYHPELDSRFLTKERLFKQVLPGKKFSAR